MSEYWRLGDDDEFVRARWKNVLAALEWIDAVRRPRRRRVRGVRHPVLPGPGQPVLEGLLGRHPVLDGTIPYLPIATAEIQGYVYDAKLRVAEMAERLMDDAELATSLRKRGRRAARAVQPRLLVRGAGRLLRGRARRRQEAHRLDDLEHGPPAVVGDRAGGPGPHRGRPSDVRGHVLRMGRADDLAHRRRVQPDRLPRGDDLASRQLDHRPWDWSGTGFRDEANRIGLAQLEAAAFSDFRLPEAFAGFDRSIGRFPVPYPTACSPQAWATGAPFVFVRNMLGLDVLDGEVRIDPGSPRRSGASTSTGCTPSGPTGTSRRPARTATSA